MSEIQIRKIDFHDLASLQKIGRQTFQETFASSNTEENMRQYLDESFSEVQLTAELTDPNSEFYFATLHQKVIGYLKLNFGDSQTEFQDKNAVEIERIYVLNEYHGKKVGQLLYNQAIRVAQLKKSDFVWLGVWEKNLRAIHFYKKNGFVEFDQHVFVVGQDHQTDLLMKLHLNG